MNLSCSIGHRKLISCNFLIFLFLLMLCAAAYLLITDWGIEERANSNYFSEVRPEKTGVCEVPEGGNLSPEQITMSSRCGMSVNAIGRLGNFMGQYATLYALSQRNGQPAYILPVMSDLLRLYFRISVPTLPEEALSYWEDNWNAVDLIDRMHSNYLQLEAPFVFLTGFPNSWTFYDHIRDEILREFRFNDVIVRRTWEKLHSYAKRRNSTTFVGVHVRRSDYVDLMNGIYRGVVAHKGFFDQAMGHFNSKYSDAIFLVVSDDLEWCRQNINNSLGNVFFVGNGDLNLPIYDLALMAHCNHSIITIGTFGFWGAYIAGGETIYLYNYTLPDSPFLDVLSYETFYLPHWIPIPADLTQFHG